MSTATHPVPRFKDNRYCNLSDTYENDQFFHLKWLITADAGPVLGGVCTQTVRLIEAYNPIEI
jgi:hypothetical protein